MSIEEIEVAIISAQATIEVLKYTASAYTGLFILTISLLIHIWKTTQKRQEEKDRKQDETLEQIGHALNGIQLLLASNGIMENGKNNIKKVK
jgi:transketolase N-terminal domain/subunit